MTDLLDARGFSWGPRTLVKTLHADGPSTVEAVPTFDPCQELSPLARRLLGASNCLHETNKWHDPPEGVKQPLPFFSGIPRAKLLPRCR